MHIEYEHYFLPGTYLIMVVIAGCALPAFFKDGQMERFCAIWQRKLVGRLDIAQMIHLGRFGNKGNALRMRAARILGRSMLLSLLPPETQLATDMAGRPALKHFLLEIAQPTTKADDQDNHPNGLLASSFGADADVQSGFEFVKSKNQSALNNASFVISFSYTESAAFCGIYHGRQNFGELRLGLDAEEWSTSKTGPVDGNGIFANIRELKSWLKFEAVHKAKGCGLPGAPKGAHRNKAFLDFNPVGYYWKYLAFPGHLVCMAANGILNERPILRWMNYSMLCNHYRPADLLS